MLTQIKAAAGAGKTYTLTRHFLNLLAGAAEKSEIPVCMLGHTPGQHTWQEIMAVTFTNKAAIEMKERIIGALKEQALLSPQPNPPLNSKLNPMSNPNRNGAHNSAEHWLELILRHYGSLNIRTIDSLLTLLVRLSCLDFGLAPDFKQVFNSEEYFAPAFDLLMQAAMQNDAELKAELQLCCRTLLHDSQVTGFIPSRRLKDRLHELCNYSLKHGKKLNTAKQEQINAKLTELASGLRDQAKLLLDLCEREQLLAKVYLTKFLQKLVELPNLPRECPKSELMHSENLAECLLANSALPGESANRAFLQLQALYQTSSRSIGVLHNARLNASFVQPVQKLLSQLNTQFKHEGYIPAALLPGLARRVLASEMLGSSESRANWESGKAEEACENWGETWGAWGEPGETEENNSEALGVGPSELFCRLGNRLRHILIDEFQDTSIEQWQAILPLAQEALSQGGSLTCVGDSKQAIYAWRGGDVALFDGLLNSPELTSIAGTGNTIELPFNWRSAPLLVNHNNLVFSRLGELKVAMQLVQNVMPEETPQAIINSTAASLQSTFAGAKQALPENRSPKNSGPENSREDQSANGLVSITSLQEKNSEDLEERIKEHLHNLLSGDILKRRPLRDVACLVRSNNQAAKLAGWLAEWNLPAITENSLQLAQHPILAQTLAFLNWLNMPLDDLALFEFISGQELFGRVSGLTPAQIEEWAAGRNQKIPLLVELRRHWPEIWQQHLAPFYNQAGLMSVYDLVCELFDRYQVEAAFPEHKVFILRFLEILFLAESENIASLPAFLEWWKEFGQEEKVPMPDSLNAIRIITIHKAKGLEFPVVILPFQEQRNQGNRAGSEFLLHKQEDLALLVNLRKDLGNVYYTKLAERVREAVNVVYVAWTRAVHELYIFLPHIITAKPASSNGIVDNLLQLFNLTQDGAEHRVGTPANTLKSLEKNQTNSNLGVKNRANAGRVTINQHRLFAKNAQTNFQTINPSIEQKNAKLQAASSHLPKEKPSPSQPVPVLPPHPMAWLPRLKIFRNILREPQFDAAARGELMHYCIEGLHPEFEPNIIDGCATECAEIGREEHTEGCTRACTAEYAAECAFNFGVQRSLISGENIAAVRPGIIKALTWLASLPQAPIWFSRGISEQIICDNQGHNFRADMVVYEPNACTVLEFKSGSLNEQEAFNAQSSGVAQAWPEHVRQIKNYLSLLAQAQTLPVTGFLIYLDQQQVIAVNPD